MAEVEQFRALQQHGVKSEVAVPHQLAVKLCKTSLFKKREIQRKNVLSLQTTRKICEFYRIVMVGCFIVGILDCRLFNIWV